MQVLIGPLERVVVGLADAAEVAGDRVGAAQVHVAAVCAAGVERLDVSGAEDLHGGGDGDDIAAGHALLGHVAHPDIAAGHELSLRDRALGLGDEPGEVLERADLEGDRVGLVEPHGVGRRAEDAVSILWQRDEGPGVTLLGEPLKAGQEGRALVAQAREPVLEAAGLIGGGVDRVYAAVALHKVEQAADEAVRGVRQSISLTASTSAA